LTALDPEPEDDLVLVFLATFTGAASLFATATVKAAFLAGETAAAWTVDVATSSSCRPSDALVALLEQPAHASALTNTTATNSLDLTRLPLRTSASLSLYHATHAILRS